MNHNGYPSNIPTPESTIAQANRHELVPDTELLLGDPIISRELASQIGVNGDIVGVICLDSDTTNNGEQQIAVVDFGQNALQAHGFRFGLQGLNYDHSSGNTAFTPIQPGSEKVYGRNPKDTASSHLGLDGNDLVSKGHFKITETNGRVSIADNHSTNGTRLIANVYAPQHEADNNPDAKNEAPLSGENIGVGHEHSAASEASKESLTFSEETLSQPVEKDANYTAIRAPYLARLQDIYDKYEPEISKLNARINIEESYGNSTADYADKLNALIKTRGEEETAARTELEQAIKPYLRERLRAFQGDTGASYLKPGELSYDNQNRAIVTKSGQRVVRTLGGMYLTDRIRLGQIMMKPERLSSWAGSSAEKVNHKTGKMTSSFEHIVDLAAAMEAGTFGEEHEPIQLERDKYAALDLQGQLQNVPFYKVRLGMHRIAAQRLVEGPDGLADYEVVGN